ncbi:hypothetical protein FA10DRAFT_269434 [Acaromyces ingoldii]|uniref:Glutaredoxin-like protein n=1 Tax=Acaromyces ingoldii TaxID=215250 RepID=A0A316YE17_9BASI|nr:hypothetical protein FA10DRAFT_269434 [Acaromyces ingoldii]PWN87479.1 hypothetical protein FA10DRAFT_269434 [Acaromyces ingoldii]
MSAIAPAPRLVVRAGLPGCTWRRSRAVPAPNRRRFSISSVAGTPSRVPRLTLYTGTHCQLCDVAHSLLVSLQKDVPFELDTYNIRDDSAADVGKWRRMYQYDIPVLHMDGKEIGRHRFEREKLLERITAASESIESSR